MTGSLAESSQAPVRLLQTPLNSEPCCVRSDLEDCLATALRFAYAVVGERAVYQSSIFIEAPEARLPDHDSTMDASVNSATVMSALLRLGVQLAGTKHATLLTAIQDDSANR